MAPDLLIIGETAEREDLSRRVEAFGYRSATASAGELARHLSEFPPAAILLCARGSEVRSLLSQLRQDPKGLGIPVILYSELGGDIRDLADVMELGADRFLVAPVDDDELRETTLELLGPSEPTAISRHLDTDADDRPLRHRDPLLAQLRRTLAALDERNEAPAGDSGEFDLDAIGLGGGPDLDAEVDASASASDLALIDVEPATQRVVRGRPRATTLRIADDAATSLLPPPTSPPKPAATADPHPPSRPTAKTSRLHDRAPASDEHAGAATQRLGERPPRASRLGDRDRDRDRPAQLPPASERGALDDAPLPELLLRLEHDRFSGHLRLSKGDAADERWTSGQDLDVVFSRGSPVEVQSRRPEDRLSEGLLRRGQIDAATARELRSRLVKESRTNVDTAIELGALKASERSSALSEHIAELLTSAFSWSGTWSLHPAPELETRGPALDRSLAAIIAEGILLELEVPVLRRRLGPGQARPRLRPGASTGDLDPPVEARALGPALDGRLTLDDIASVGGRPLLAWIYALRVLGRLELDGPAIGPDDPQSPAEANAAAIDLRRIRAALGPARKGDYFALLDLPVEASRGELRRAHHKLRETFADERLEASTRTAQATELRELRAALDEARDVLLDDALRAAYLAYREG